MCVQCSNPQYRSIFSSATRRPRDCARPRTKSSGSATTTTWSWWTWTRTAVTWWPWPLSSSRPPYSPSHPTRSTASPPYTGNSIRSVVAVGFAERAKNHWFGALSRFIRLQMFSSTPPPPPPPHPPHNHFY